GVGHLLRGYSLEGAADLFLFLFFLTRLLFWQGWVPSLLVLPISLNLPWIILAGVLFIIFYGWVQYRIRALQAKGGDIDLRSA
ncbi:MAG: hypothetical protein NTY64_21360, partial [Deltaproteobacteria bacterium]|nr:hypothetical protein [Deltaproteobacteria bacterium]